MRWGNREELDLERQELELALVNEIVERGFIRASVAGVCRRAGLGRDAYFRHFEDLEDGYCEVMDSLIALVFGGVLADFDGQQTWRDQIRAAAYAIFDFLDEDRRRGRFMIVEIFNAGDRAQAIRDAAIGVLVELIDQGRAELDDPDSLTRATAEALAGSVFRKVRIALEEDDPHADELLPKLMYSVIQPYMGVDEALRELEIRRRHQLV